MQVCRCAGMQVCRYVGMQVCRYVGMQVCRCAGVQDLSWGQLSERVYQKKITFLLSKKSSFWGVNFSVFP